MNQYQTALEDIVTFHSSPSPTPSLISANSKCNIPEDLNLDNVYNPTYDVIQLISARKRPRKQTIPPRPPNSFFLFKSCYMLELRKLGYRFCMPDVCRQSKLIWTRMPSDVKDRYDNLALQAQILYQEMYPGYKFKPKKRHVFFPESVVGNSMLNAFEDTTKMNSNIENTTNSQNSESFPSTETSSSSSSPTVPSSFSTSPIVASPESPLQYATDHAVTDPILLFPFDLVYPENLLEYDLNSFNDIDVMIQNQSIGSFSDDSSSFLMDDFSFQHV